MSLSLWLVNLSSVLQGWDINFAFWWCRPNIYISLRTRGVPQGCHVWSGILKFRLEWLNALLVKSLSSLCSDCISLNLFNSSSLEITVLSSKILKEMFWIRLSVPRSFFFFRFCRILFFTCFCNSVYILHNSMEVTGQLRFSIAWTLYCWTSRHCIFKFLPLIGWERSSLNSTDHWH